MAFQIVQCEVQWVVDIGFSGNELPPARYERLGIFETEQDAEQALVELGRRRSEYSFPQWKDRTGYGVANIVRVLKEMV